MSDETQAQVPPNLSREERLEQVLAEYLRQVEHGAPVDQQAWLAAHPDLADDLREFFGNQMRIQRLVGAASPPHGRNGTPTRLRYFGDYEILEVIAQGGMGVVYKARQTTLNRVVAVKMILAGQLANESDVKRFQAEAEAAANLHHPGVVGIYEVGVQDGQHYYSMEYIDGQNLAQAVREKPLSVTQAAKYVREVAEVLEYAHQRKVLHRDLKPSNILLDAAGRLRITDFGLAKRVEGESDLTMTGQVLGTPSYMSPEQAAAQHAIIGPPTDIYALGAILYELITGRPPFRSESIGEILRQVQHDEPVRPRLLNPKLPRDLETICLKCLEKEPKRRYSSAQELADELGRFLRGEPIRARRIGPLSRGIRWCRRNPTVSGLSSTIAILLLVIAIACPVGYAWLNWAWEREEQRSQLEDDLLVKRADELVAGREPDFAEADRKLSQVIERHPTQAELYAKRALVRHEQGKNAQSLADCQKAIDLGLESEEIHLQVVLAALGLGQQDLARQHAQMLLAKDAQCIEAVLAHSLTAVPDAKSLETLQEGFQKRPYGDRMMSLRGQAAFHIVQYQGTEKAYDQATSDLVRTLQNRPYDLRARQALCLCYIQFYFLADLKDRPLAAAKALVDKWPPEGADWRADAFMALWQLKSERYSDAVKICESATKRFSDRPEFTHVLGLALQMQKEYPAADKALARCQELLAKQPVTLWPMSKIQLVSQRAIGGAAARAQEEWRRKLVEALINDDPKHGNDENKHWSYQDWHAVVYAHASLKPAETGGWCHRWRELAPECPTPYCFGIPKNTTGVNLDEALRLAPSHRSARLDRAKQYEQNGSYPEAIGDCEIYLRLKPAASEAMLLLTRAMLLHARALAEAPQPRNYPQARALIDKVISMEPKNASAWEILSRIDRNEGRHAEALTAIRKAWTLDPQNVDYQLQKGWLLMTQGSVDEALAHIEALSKSRPPISSQLQEMAEILSIPTAADARCGERAAELMRQAMRLVAGELPVDRKNTASMIVKVMEGKLAAALYRSNRWEEALRENTYQRDEFPGPDNLRDLFQAMILFRLGRENEARNIYDQAAAKAGEDLVAFDPREHRRASARQEVARLLGYHFDQEAKTLDVARHNVRLGDSPQLGGWGAQNNISESRTVPVTWHPGKFDRKTGAWNREKAQNIKWTVPLGSQTYGNPVVANGKVFVGTNNSYAYLKRLPDDIDLGCLLCFRESDGEFLWQFSSEKLPTGRVHDWPMMGICSAPLVEGDRLWFVSNRGLVLCLDAEGRHDGKDDGLPMEPIKEVVFNVQALLSNVLAQRPIHPVLRERLAAERIEVADDQPLRNHNGWRWQKKTNGKLEDWLTFEVEGDGLRIHELAPASEPKANREFTIRNAIWPEQGKPSVINSLRKTFASAGVNLPVDLQVKTEQEGRRWSFDIAATGGVEHYTVTLDGSLRGQCLRTIRPDDIHEADVVWQLDMMKELGVSQHNMCTCPPASWGNILFICTSNGVNDAHIAVAAPEAPSFIALDKHTGKILWTDNSPGANIHHGQWSGPAVGVLDGVPQVIFPGGDGWVYSFHAEEYANGKPKLLWKFDVNAKDAELMVGGKGTRNEVIALPVIYDGRVYVSSGQDPEHGEGQGQLWCIDPTKRGDISRQLVVDIKDRNRVIPHRREKAIIRENGEILIDNPNSGVAWLFDRLPPNRNPQESDYFYDQYHRSLSSVAVKNDLLIAGDGSGLVHCLNAKTGKVLWQHDALAAIWGSPLIIGERVLVPDEDGDVVVLPLSPFVIHRPIAPDHDYAGIEPLAEINMGGSITTTPVVAQDVLYIATRDHLFAISQQAEAKDAKQTAKTAKSPAVAK